MTSHFTGPKPEASKTEAFKTEAFKTADSEFETLGGVASSNPSRLVRWLTSKVLTRVVNLERIKANHKRNETRRKKNRSAHQIYYFHQVDDPYSHLAVQTLVSLLSTYDIQITPYLVSGPSGNNAPEPELLLEYARKDCGRIAAHYQLNFPIESNKPSQAQTELATKILAAQLLNSASTSGFAEISISVGEALWNQTDLQALAKQHGIANAESTKHLVAEGSTRQAQLKHYSGAMFYYGEEWYWGVDRIYHLEQRLIDLQVNRTKIKAPLIPRPAMDAAGVKAKGLLTLEMYFSLRSPYSSIIFNRCAAFCQHFGINLVLRPVLPMVMRGAAITRQKGLYIFFDAAREAKTLGLNWGKIADPIGEPVRNAYSLFPWAREQGREYQLINAFFQAAFFNGINTNTNKGMRLVVENAGLPWQQAKAIMGNTDWQGEIEANRLAIYRFQSWGVPSFRLLDANCDEIIEVWGQDRLWLIATEVKRWLASH